MGYTLEVRCPCSPRVVVLPVAYFEETATAASKTPLRPCGVAYVVVGRPRYIWQLASTGSVAEALVPTGQLR